MNYKTKIILLIGTAIIIFGIGYSLANLIQFEFETCGIGYQQDNNLNSSSDKIELTPSCAGYRGFLSSLDREIGLPFMLFSSISVFFLFILIFFQEHVFHAWSKFAIIFLPIAFVLIMISSPSSGGFIFPSHREIMTIFLPVFFIVASTALILAKSFRPAWRLWAILPIAFVISVIGLVIVASIL
jgi:hypothetical protein